MNNEHLYMILKVATLTCKLYKIQYFQLHILIESAIFPKHYDVTWGTAYSGNKYKFIAFCNIF